MAMLEGDELIVRIEGRPAHVSIFEIGITWVTTPSTGEHVYWVACKFKGIEAGETYKVVAIAMRAREGDVLRLEADLVCDTSAEEYATYILESRLGYWRPK